MTDAILAAAVLAAMGGLAVHDARRALVDPRMVLALLATGAAWRFAGPGGAEGAWPRLAAGVLGASLGVAAVAIPIGVAAWLGRRWRARWRSGLAHPSCCASCIGGWA